MKVFVLVIRAYGINIKRLKQKNRLHHFYNINGITRIKLIEYGPVKTITHSNNLEEIFPMLILIIYSFILLLTYLF